MDSNWTPGPWLLKEFDLSSLPTAPRNNLIVDSGGRIIAYARRDAEFRSGEGDANAALLAAAPELAKAIKYTLEFIGDEEITRSDGEALDVERLKKALDAAINVTALGRYLAEGL